MLSAPLPPTAPPGLAAALAGLAAAGLDLQGVAAADAPAVQALLPGAQSVVVLGSGGGRLWAGLCDAIRADPAVLRDAAHPLDAHVAGLVRAADAALGPLPRRWVLCGAVDLAPAADDAPPPFLDFRALAHAAGLGHPSRLGLLIHPTVGPWLGLRAALLLAAPLPPTGPLPGAGPCPGCAAPCAAACPVAAVPAPGAPDRFAIRACARHRADGGCPTACAARNACPEGAAHRYTALEQHYHDNRRTGRPALAEALGVADDPLPGLGPQWAAWAAPAPGAN